MAREEANQLRFSNSYRVSLVLSFAAVAAVTALIIMVMVAVVFNAYFRSYTSDNMEAVSDFAAERIAEEYSYTRSLNNLDYEHIVQTLQVSEEAGIMVLDSEGNVLYGNTSDSSGAGPSEASQVAISSIQFNSNEIGSVRIWIYGSDVLMSKLDIAFRDSTYTALLLSGILAIIVALLVGIWFSSSLIKPLRRITQAAYKLSTGDLSARTGLVGRSEVAQLGETFDEMAASIEKDRQLELRLTSDVAHELRTPLMAIQATVEAMMDGVYETDSEHLALVDSEVRRLSRLVDALLKLSRLEMRSQPLKEEICDLGEVVEGIVTTHEVFVHDSGLSMEAHVEGTVKAVCDRDMIRQAVANLISNAVRYTPEGGRIDVYVFQKEGWAAIAVRDTGIGLTPEEEKMVFSRFWRADSGRTRESGGLGIGLSVVKEIVDQHHGRLSVKGEKDVGSVFTIMLPAYNEEASRKQARAAIKVFESRNKKLLSGSSNPG